MLRTNFRRLNDASLHIAAYFGRWKHRYGLERSRSGLTATAAATATVRNRAGWESSVRMEKIQTQLRSKLFGSADASHGPAVSFLSPELKSKTGTAGSRMYSSSKNMMGVKLGFAEAGLDDVGSAEKSRVHYSHSRTPVVTTTPMSDPRGGAGPMNIYELM